MKLPSRYLTLIGVIIALSAVLLDSTFNAALASLIGEQAATKVAAFGAVLAAVGRALFPTQTELEGKEPSP